MPHGFPKGTIHEDKEDLLNRNKNDEQLIGNLV
jgi:hypothetical protein